MEHWLIQQNLEEVLKGFKIQHTPVLRDVVARLSYNGVKELSQRVLRFDARVGQVGLQSASQWLIEEFTSGIVVEGVENIPQDKPLMICSNHPGQSDAFAVCASIPRQDLRIIALQRDLLNALPNTLQSLLIVPQPVEEKQKAVRQIAAYLRTGGSILTFPAGQIEPDPAIRPSLFQWSESVGLFAHLVPELQILPVIVSGVLSKNALHNPLVQLYRDPKQREWTAAVLQTLVPAYQNVTVQVRFGKVIHADRSSSRAEITQQVTRQMYEFVQNLR
jgi:1-acyl-sn-glycerol-3-phosphate acyltransferase